MIVLIDSNNYFTGTYCKVGSIPNGIDVGDLELPNETDNLKLQSYKLNIELKQKPVNVIVKEKYIMEKKTKIEKVQKTNENGEPLYEQEDGSEGVTITDKPIMVDTDVIYYEERIVTDKEIVDESLTNVLERNKLDENRKLVYEEKLVVYNEYYWEYDSSRYNSLIEEENKNKKLTVEEELKDLKDLCYELVEIMA